MVYIIIGHLALTDQCAFRNFQPLGVRRAMPAK